MKQSILLLFLFIFTNSHSQELPPNQLMLPDSSYKIPFVWQADSINGKWDPYGAMLLPVKLPGINRQYYMQFDLGSPFSMFYSNKLKTVPTIFYIGEMKIQTKSIATREMNDSGTLIIGTIGSDFIENKTILINYPEKYLVIGNDVSPTITLTDFIFIQRRVLLPVTLKGKNTILYFDTGSSAFELLTDQKTVLSMAAPGAKPNSYPVQSWNKTLTATSYPTNDSITIGSQTIPLINTTYVEGASGSQVNQMMKLGIGGMTGNKLFLKYILLIDTKNKKFGVTKNKS